jgi:stalled ribosome rescue protein Dom34
LEQVFNCWTDKIWLLSVIVVKGDRLWAIGKKNSKHEIRNSKQIKRKFEIRISKSETPLKRKKHRFHRAGKLKEKRAEGQGARAK